MAAAFPCAVVGGTGTMPNLKVVHIAVEMAPIAKVGDSCFSHSCHGICRRGADPHGKHARSPVLTAPTNPAPRLTPFLQAGGLGDVVTALGRAVQEEGHEVEVIMPKYDCIDYGQVKVGHA
jgi:hypothetical protein